MITYYTSKKVDIHRLIKLFEQAGWADKLEPVRLQEMLDNSQVVVTAWCGELMVGFARCTLDYVFNGQINNVVVDKEYRNMGIGRELVNIILNSSDKVTYILRGDPDNHRFYSKLGFKDAEAMIYKRKV